MLKLESSKIFDKIKKYKKQEFLLDNITDVDLEKDLEIIKEQNDIDKDTKNEKVQKITIPNFGNFFNDWNSEYSPLGSFSSISIVIKQLKHTLNEIQNLTDAKNIRSKYKMLQISKNETHIQEIDSCLPNNSDCLG